MLSNVSESSTPALHPVVPPTLAATSLSPPLPPLPNEIFGYMSTYLNENVHKEARLVNRSWAAWVPPSVHFSLKWLATRETLPHALHRLKIQDQETLTVFLERLKGEKLPLSQLDLSHFLTTENADNETKHFLGISKARSEFLKLCHKTSGVQTLNLSLPAHGPFSSFTPVNSLDKQYIANLPISDICHFSNACHSLTEINLSANTITEINLTPKELGFACFPTVTKLNLSHASLTATVLNHLLPLFPNLRHLDLSRCCTLHKTPLALNPGVHLSSLISLQIGFTTGFLEYQRHIRNYYLDNVRNFLLNTQCTKLEALSLDGYEHLPDSYTDALEAYATISTEVNNLLLMALAFLPHLKNLELNFKEDLISLTEELCANLQKLTRLKLSTNHGVDFIKFLAAGYFSNTQLSGKLIDKLRKETFLYLAHVLPLTLQPEPLKQQSPLNKAGLINFQRYCANTHAIQNAATENFSYNFDIIDLSNTKVPTEILNDFLPSCLKLTKLYIDNCPEIDLNQLLITPQLLKIFSNLTKLKLSIRTTELNSLEKFIVAASQLRELSLTGTLNTENKTDLQELVSWLGNSQNKKLNSCLANLRELTFTNFFIEDIATFTNFLDAIDNLRSITGARPLSVVKGSFYLATAVSESGLRQLIQDRCGTSIDISTPADAQPLRKCDIEIDMTMRPGRQSLEDTLDPFPVNTQRRSLPQLMQTSWNYALSCIIGYGGLLNSYGRIFLNSLWGLSYMSFNLSDLRRFVGSFWARPPSLPPPTQNA